MNNSVLSKLNLRLHALSIFRALLNDPVINALTNYFDALEQDSLKLAVNAYSEFIAKLYATNSDSLAQYISDIVNDNENIFIFSVGCNKTPAENLKNALKCELQTLQEVADLNSRKLIKTLNCAEFLPQFEAKSVDIVNDYFHRVDNIGVYGYGIYARYRMFYIGESGEIVPVKNPDTTSLDDLYDYEREKKIIVDNTLALLDNKPAANILLTGDAGTGKSSTVKAVVNELYKKGLRILEVRKDQLKLIPAILDSLTLNPLKFILFIDDLSFQKDDDNYSALKAILEGSVSAKSQNVVIYATSNRRHLVKESFTDRDGDDIHFNDTIQEIQSLSDRFGIHVTFQKPDKKTYLDIVTALAKTANLTIDQSELTLLAERFALERGGRSARAAKQFIDGLVAKG